VIAEHSFLNAAAEQLVREFGDRLLRSAYLLCGNEADAKDLVQETFIQAVRSVGRFRGASAIFTWLYGILLNVTRHYIRKRKHAEKLFTQRLLKDRIPEEPDDDDKVGSQWASAMLTYAIHQLSTDHREMIILKFFEEMKTEEIAHYLTISPGTVKSRLHYALKALRKKVPFNLNLLEP